MTEGGEAAGKPAEGLGKPGDLMGRRGTTWIARSPVLTEMEGRRIPFRAFHTFHAPPAGCQGLLGTTELEP